MYRVWLRWVAHLEFARVECLSCQSQPSLFRAKESPLKYEINNYLSSCYIDLQDLTQDAIRPLKEYPQLFKSNWPCTRICYYQIRDTTDLVCPIEHNIYSGSKTANSWCHSRAAPCVTADRRQCETHFPIFSSGRQVVLATPVRDSGRIRLVYLY